MKLTHAEKIETLSYRAAIRRVSKLYGPSAVSRWKQNPWKCLKQLNNVWAMEVK